MEQKQEEQKYDFTDKQRTEILRKRFKVGEDQNECEDKSLEKIIDGIINAIKNDNNYKNCIQKYWFTKQIEKWKKDDNNKNKELSEDELMDMVKKDLKVRIANTMLALEQELKKHEDINEEDIWFYQQGKDVVLQHNNDDICRVLDFNFSWQHISPPYKPFFMTNKNDDDKLNGVCIYKHGDDKKKIKWIMACFKDDCTKPQCKITFQTNENNKITNVKIKNKKDKNSKSTYTISLDEAGKVEQITKKGEEEEENKDKNNYKDEIKQLLFEDDINKVLIENIECELNREQKKVFDKIKAHLGIKEEHDEKKWKNKENNQINNPKPKYTLCGFDNDICGFKESGGFGCCGW